MGAKGEKTRQMICQKAYSAFAENGYKEVTMKDLCERTGLSRGGLYRHYESTEQIFMEILNGFLDRQENEFQSKIQDHVPASVILDEILERYENEMSDSGNSLSIAICEFFSNPEISKDENFLRKQYLSSKEMWINMIEYGIRTGEFKDVDPEAVFDLMAFSYEGIRMYSRMMDLDEQTPHRIIEQIRSILLKSSEIILVKPTAELKHAALDYRKEHFQKGETVINGSELLDQTESYEEWLKSVTLNAAPETVSSSWVLTDTFFAIRKRDKKIIGIIDLRHTLNDFLKDFGNCGYSVRPSERRKGYATEMLGQIISVARESGMKELHLSVERNNIPSVKTIIKNGGIYERSFSHENEMADIYKISL